MEIAQKLEKSYLNSTQRLKKIKKAAGEISPTSD